MINKALKQGDMLWQNCLPGGVCLFIRIVSDGEEWLQDNWDRTPEPEIFEVLHPTLGCVEEPSYYFDLFEDAITRMNE